jgi:sortase B
MWQVFSVYHIPTTTDYLKIKFNDKAEYGSFLNALMQRSAHNFRTNVSAEDKILTLSTCYNKQERMVLHAKLIKRQAR